MTTKNASRFIVGALLALYVNFFAAWAQDSVSTDYNSYMTGADATPFQTFKSNPAIKPPEFLVTKQSSITAKDEGYFFLAFGGGRGGGPSSGQTPPCIYDMGPPPRLGTIVWCSLDYPPAVADFRVQTYKGKPVLTFWAGVMETTHGEGSYYILDDSYTLIKKFDAVGLPGDSHEFQITENNTALVPVYTPVKMDLSAVNGTKDGWAFDCIVQEIDIESGKLLFEWHSADNVQPTDTCIQLGIPAESGNGTQANPLDYFHLNAISKDSQGNYLISARNACTVYKISGEKGDIIWRLSTVSQSNFKVELRAAFAYQHMPRWVNPSQRDYMTLWDNGPGPGLGPSKGLLLKVDEDACTVSFIQDFMNTNKTWTMAAGSNQVLDPDNLNSSNFVIGYGTEPFFTELDRHGNVLLDVQMAQNGSVRSYRAFRMKWTADPTTNPDFFYDPVEKKAYASWMGATEVETWVIEGASNQTLDRPAEVAKSQRTGFETVVDVSHANTTLKWFWARALDEKGKILGNSNATDGHGNWVVPKNKTYGDYSTKRYERSGYEWPGNERLGNDRKPDHASRKGRQRHWRS